MNKFALIALVLVGCSDEGLSPEMVDCSVKTVDGQTATKCSPICVQFDAKTNPHDGFCQVATFAGSSEPSACNFVAAYLKDENGNEHYGCCASGGWAGADDFFPGANVPAGEMHFYECDRSEWPEQKP